MPAAAQVSASSLLFPDLFPQSCSSGQTAGRFSLDANTTTRRHSFNSCPARSMRTYRGVKQETRTGYHTVRRSFTLSCSHPMHVLMHPCCFLIPVYYEASTSLPQLDSETTQFRDLLLRMSLKDDSASSRALLYSIFCLSAVRRYGNVQECAHFKTLALQALQQATTSTTLTTAQVLQHVAAGLMLCRSEARDPDSLLRFLNPDSY